MKIPTLLCEFKRMYETLNSNISKRYSLTMGNINGIKKNENGNKIIENTAPKIPPIK